MKYKKYLLTGGPVPRSTAYYRKRKEQQQVSARQESNAGTSQEVLAPVSDNQPTEDTYLNAPVGTLKPVDVSTDQEVLFTAQSQGKRKPITKKKCQRDQSKPTTSSDQAASSSDWTSSSDSDEPCDVSAAHRQVPDGVFHLNANEVLDGESSDDGYEDILRNNDQDTKPICPCVSTTDDDLLFMCLSYGLRHGLSWTAQVDLLKMMRAVLGDKNIPLSKSKYLQKLNAAKESDIQYHVYCDDCHAYIGRRESCEWFCAGCKKVFEVDEAVDCADCHVPLVKRELKATEKTVSETDKS